MAERGVGAELVTLLQWDRLIGTTIEFTFVAGMLALIVSVFTGRDSRPTGGGS